MFEENLSFLNAWRAASKMPLIEKYSHPESNLPAG